MALKDIDSNYYTWYAAASNNKMTDYTSATSEDFGTGRTNTANMISKWNNKAYGEQNTKYSYKDMWCVVQKQVADGWFVPSRSEWSVFGGEFGVVRDNRVSLGLSGDYWSSSQCGIASVWDPDPNNNSVGKSIVSGLKYVRLARTF